MQAAGTGTDPLLAEFKTTNPATGKAYTSSFGWINHTWDHPNLDQGCATQNYIEAEIQQNTAWASSAAGLNLTTTSDPTVALGAQNPGVLVTGEHSGLANLIPGNPGTVDPPSFNAATANATGATAGGAFSAAQPTVTYAITDQFSTTGGESSASTTVQSVPAGGSVTLTWDAACHAADYKIYRQIADDGSMDSADDDPGAEQLVRRPHGRIDDRHHRRRRQHPDLHRHGRRGNRLRGSLPPTTNNATETAYQQNTNFAAALAAVGIKAFGSDSSKPYPNPATTTFTSGSPPSTQFAERRDVHRRRGAGRGALPDEHLLQRLDRGPGGRRVQPPVSAAVARRGVREQLDDDVPDRSGDVRRHHQEHRPGHARSTSWATTHGPTTSIRAT